MTLSVSDIYGYPKGAVAQEKTSPGPRQAVGAQAQVVAKAFDQRPGLAVLAMFLVLVLFKFIFE